MCSLVSVFCSRLFSVNQLTFEIYIILCQYSDYSFIQDSKSKSKFGEINIWTAISSHQVMGMSLTKLLVMENIQRWIWSFSCNWLAENKRKWAGHGLSYGYPFYPLERDMETLLPCVRFYKCVIIARYYYVAERSDEMISNMFVFSL